MVLFLLKTQGKEQESKLRLRGRLSIKKLTGGRNGAYYYVLPATCLKKKEGFTVTVLSIGNIYFHYYLYTL